jgi:2-succinyl-5-enolpyruvyl-6-hydroxy-3-cyclohexene-1-carboxylate synthase
LHEIILDTVEICYRKGINKFIICPGSRSAPLTLALARHPHVQTWVIDDERVAAFTALGMALQTSETIGLVCTSGTAVLNFAPAVAEAFFQEVPLLILTADRPPEWIAQQDGQTLFQKEVYGKNVKGSFEIPADTSHPDAKWFSQRIVNEAINLTQNSPKGPSHINIPLREPLYPKPEEKFDFNRNIKIIKPLSIQKSLSQEAWDEIMELWESAEKRLIVAAQYQPDEKLLVNLKRIQEEWEIPVVGDIVSNLHSLSETIRHQDLFLMQTDEVLLETLCPDLLITFGKSLISKNLKTFLRKHPPRYHLHIQPGGVPADTFQTLTHIAEIQPGDFFEKLFADIDFLQYQSGDDPEWNSEYNNIWQVQDRKAMVISRQFLQNQVFNEFSALKTVMENLPKETILHLSNSMPVRYANQCPPLSDESTSALLEVFANRGTSGIDGCTSTAVGAARMTDKPVVLITGDIAFFYDRNALWQPNLPVNLRIIILNNHGGGIFRLIDAGNQPEVTEFFETPHHLNAQNTARDFGLEYALCQDFASLENTLSAFFEPSAKAKILEIETDVKTNEQVYKALKKMIAEG